MLKLKKFREIRNRRANGEKGFTLIELLVVIIIIGILASIAIPIFMNQQKTARDAATTSDMKNAVTQLKTLDAAFPGVNLEGYMITDNNINPLPEGLVSITADENFWVVDDNNDGILRIWAAPTVASPRAQWKYVDISLTKGTRIYIDVETAEDSGPTPHAEYVLYGYNPNGKAYNAYNKTLMYKTSTGFKG